MANILKHLRCVYLFNPHNCQHYQQPTHSHNNTNTRITVTTLDLGFSPLWRDTVHGHPLSFPSHSFPSPHLVSFLAYSFSGMGARVMFQKSTHQWLPLFTEYSLYSSECPWIGCQAIPSTTRSFSRIPIVAFTHCLVTQTENGPLPLSFHILQTIKSCWLYLLHIFHTYSISLYPLSLF